MSSTVVTDGTPASSAVAYRVSASMPRNSASQVRPVRPMTPPSTFCFDFDRPPAGLAETGPPSGPMPPLSLIGTVIFVSLLPRCKLPPVIVLVRHVVTPGFSLFGLGQPANWL